MKAEIYAICYGRSVRTRGESFIGGDPHDGPMPMAYYIWLIRQQGRLLVVDTGFDAMVATKRNREFLICPGAAIQQLGFDPQSVEDVVLTHLHYDHAGNHHLFSRAKFHIQAAEMAYTTGPWMTHRHLRVGYGADDVKSMVDRLFAEKVVFHDGDIEIYPGVRLHKIGGHTDGLQVVCVDTDRGPVILASDAAVFYETLEGGRPFPAAFHVGQELAGYRKLLELAGSVEHIVPGHDVAVMERYPEVLDGIAWRVDLPPIR